MERDKETRETANRELHEENRGLENQAGKWRGMLDQVVGQVNRTKECQNWRCESVFGARVEVYGQHQDMFRIRCRRCKAKHN
jgi:hypothetical protein